MSDIDRIVEYVSTLDPGFAKAIRGAELADLEQLEKLIGRAPAPLYRDFLARMGASMDWITVQNARFDIGSVMAFYRNPKWKVPANSIWIARTMNEAGYDIYLTNGRVISFAPPEEGEKVDMAYLTPVAGSLPEMIGAAAFRTVRMNRHPHGLRLYQDQPSQSEPADVARVLAPLGFASLWFSTDWGTVCESPEAGVVAMKGTNSVLVVDCASADAKLLEESASRITRELGMKELQVPGIWRNT